MNFLSTLPKPSKNLQCSLIPLKDWKVIKIEGIDTIQYLQGQLTCDLNTIDINQYTFAAYCNPHGKMINNMYVLHLNSGIALIVRNEMYKKQITEMKKYAIFSKVKISLNNHVTLFGVAGINARKILNTFFEKLPNIKTTIIRNIKTTILYFNFPKERFLFITPNAIETNITNTLTSKMKISNNLQWIALDIEAGYPIITHATSEQFIPQETNIHLLNGISFHKGCYLGQEIIARTQYKKINKRGLYWLIGSHHTHKLPEPGDQLEIKTNCSWKLTGSILMSCKINIDEIWIQAIINHSIKNNIPLRIANNPNTTLQISTLPYLPFNQ